MQKNKDDNNFNINTKMRELLLKKAEGFYYEEEIFEYSYEPAKKNGVERTQIGLFENNDESLINNDSSEKVKILNNSKIVTMKNGKSKKCIVKCDKKDKGDGDESLQRTTLSKKKVTTHFVPPDMSAIKMLLEIYSKNLDNDLSNLTDAELDNLINELSNSG